MVAIMCQSPAPILIITGMHRSGTSVVAAALASAGLHVGSRLMPGGRGNPRGHFEDLDFVSLHERILRANGIGTEGFTTATEIPVPPSLADEAVLLVEQRRLGQTPWGWKDPRTTLFLEWWARLLPEARFLLLFRSPAEVIDSLFRRGDDTFSLNPGFALDVWSAYNRRIHDFQRAHPDRCHLAAAETAVADPRRLVAAVRDRWGFPLGEPAGVADPHLFRHRLDLGRRSLVAHGRPAALELHATLLAAAGLPPDPKTEQPRDPVSLALAEWARGSSLESRASTAETELAEARSRAETLAQEMAAARRELARLESAERRSSRKPLPARISREARRLARQAGWFGSDVAGAKPVPEATPRRWQ